MNVKNTEPLSKQRLIIMMICILIALSLCFLIGVIIFNILDNGTPVSKPMSIESSAVQKGELVLVNADHKYSFPETEVGLVNIADIKTDGFYKLRSGDDIFLKEDAAKALDRMLVDLKKATGSADATIWSGYRTEAEQKALADAGTGIPAGESESHTGYSVAIKFHDGTITYTTDDAKYKTQYEWLMNNCHKYGFIQRYPDNKSRITGIDDYNYCFRYVGEVHATNMKNGYCLEEYVEELHKYTDSENPLTVTLANGDRYAMFSCKMSGKSISVKAPEGASVTGDNSGYIVVSYKLSGK